jgi:hypothetical protein
MLWAARFRALGLAAATMLWVNHAPALTALGACRREFYREVWMEQARFIHRLRRQSRRARKPRFVAPDLHQVAWNKNQGYEEFAGKQTGAVAAAGVLLSSTQAAAISDPDDRRGFQD